MGTKGGNHSVTARALLFLFPRILTGIYQVSHKRSFFVPCLVQSHVRIVFVSSRKKGRKILSNEII